MNVPDDWGMYYYSCEYCNAQCHASEGGCDCSQSLIAESDRPWLEESGYDFDGSTWSKRVRGKIRTARRDHKNSWVKKGDKYSEVIYRHISDDSGESYHTRGFRLVK